MRRAYIRLGNADVGVLHQCEVAAARTGGPARCSLDVQAPHRASEQATGE